MQTVTKIDKDDSSVITKKFVKESFDRITGSKLVGKCDVRLLKDAEENYPAWLEAIGNARDRIFFESYIIHEDAQGELFADALIARAKQGSGHRRAIAP
ncbi:MAG: hypothetical protein ABI686_11465 [Acidobacteriota bacterium]